MDGQLAVVAEVAHEVVASSVFFPGSDSEIGRRMAELGEPSDESRKWPRTPMRESRAIRNNMFGASRWALGHTFPEVVGNRR